MPQPVPTINGWHVAVVILFLSATGASLTAWSWAIWRLVTKRPLLADDDVAASASPIEVDSNAVAPNSEFLSETPASGRVGPVRPGWRGRTVLVAFLLLLFVQYLIPKLYQEAWRSGFAGKVIGTPGDHSKIIDLIRLNTSATLLLVLLLVPVVRWSSGFDLKALGLVLSRRLMRDLRAGIVACLLIAPITYLVLALAARFWNPMDRPHPIQQMIQEEGAAKSAALTLLSAVVVAPIAEELLFRGILLGWLTSIARQYAKRRQLADIELGDSLDEASIARPHDFDGQSGTAKKSTLPKQSNVSRTPWVPNLCVSLLFAAVHADQWPAPLALFVLSLGLGWLAQRTGRLGASITMHALFNGFSTTTMLLLTLGGPINTQPGPEKAVKKIEVVQLPADRADVAGPAVSFRQHSVPGSSRNRSECEKFGQRRPNFTIRSCACLTRSIRGLGYA